MNKRYPICINNYRLKIKASMKLGKQPKIKKQKLVSTLGKLKKLRR
jgi:hypothetical protein